MKLKGLVLEVLARQVATHFADVPRPIRELQSTAMSEKGCIHFHFLFLTCTRTFDVIFSGSESREAKFEESKYELATCSERVARAAQQVALVSANKKLTETVNHLTTQVKTALHQLVRVF